MRAPKSLLAPLIVSLSLSACADGRVIEPLAAADPGPAVKAQAERKKAITDSLAARCPTPGQLSSADLTRAADDLEKQAVGDHWLRMAGEYDRLDDETKACRNGGRKG